MADSASCNAFNVLWTIQRLCLGFLTLAARVIPLLHSFEGYQLGVAAVLEVRMRCISLNCRVMWTVGMISTVPEFSQPLFCLTDGHFDMNFI